MIALLVDLKDDMRDALARYSFAADVALEPVEESNVIPRLAAAGDVGVVVFGDAVGNPLQLAHQVHALNKDVPLLLVVKSDGHDALQSAVAASPFLGFVRCLNENAINDLAAQLDDILGQERTQHANYDSEQARQIADYMLQSAPVGICLLDPEKRIVSINAAAFDILKQHESTLLGEQFANLFPEHTRSRLLLLFDEASDPGNAPRTFPRAPGGQLQRLVVAVTHTSARGQFNGYLVSINDVTQSTLALEEVLLRSQARYHRMVEEIHDYAILRMDVYGNIENWNKGAEHLKGYEASEIVGESVRVFYTEEDLRDGLPERLIDTAIERGRASHECWQVRKDGSKLWGSVTITALHDKDDVVIGFSQVTRDLTERKRAEEALEARALELESKNKELEQFIYVASHDLQEPLRTVVSFVDLLENQYRDKLDENADEYLRFISQASKNMSLLITDLVDYLRIGRNKSLQNVDCGVLLNEVIAKLDPTIRKTGAQIVVPKLPTLEAYEAELRQVFSNLLSNALKFQKENTLPRVEVAAQEKAGIWQFSVRDNGIGIEPEHRDKVFRMFQRLHTRSEYEGTGIGLAHCRKIVEMHGGEIWFESQVEDGSTFHFTIQQVQKTWATKKTSLAYC